MDSNIDKSYLVENPSVSAKRICLTLNLKDDPKLIEEYETYHSSEKHWLHISQGIKSAGIKVMDIYRLDTRLFMICEVPEVEDFDRIWNSISELPGQAEWAEQMAQFQQAIPGHGLGWIKMEQIYSLNEFVQEK
ncbi:MAG: L-rhamnose mutarotase [Prolixibacteraceae bacterium]|jgi:L-rhamnose mutarotase